MRAPLCHPSRNGELELASLAGMAEVSVSGEFAEKLASGWQPPGLWLTNRLRLLPTLAEWGTKQVGTIQDDILEEFYKRLEKADGFTQDKVNEIRNVFSGGKKPKASDLIKVLSGSPKETLP